MSTDQTTQHSSPTANADDVAPLPDADMRRLEVELNADLQNVELNQLYARELMKRVDIFDESKTSPRDVER